MIYARNRGFHVSNAPDRVVWGGGAVRALGLALGLAVILGLLGINESLLLTTFGAAGLALGLAAQDILKSFFAGLYLLFERPFLIGDEIEVKESVGRVERVGFRATTIVTADNVRVTVPNAIIFSDVVRNRTQRKDSSAPARRLAKRARAPVGRSARAALRRRDYAPR